MGIDLKTRSQPFDAEDRKAGQSYCGISGLDVSKQNVFPEM